MSHEQLKICKQCSKPIVDTTRHKFCTAACMTAWHDQKHKHTKAVSITPSTRTCAFCHKPLSAEAGAYGTYCSELCQRKAAEDDGEDMEVLPSSTTPLTPTLVGVCKKCDKRFTTKTRPVRLYCTSRCRRQAVSDGDVKLGGAATKAKMKQAAPSSWRRAVAVVKALPSRLRRGLAGIFQAAATKLSK